METTEILDAMEASSAAIRKERRKAFADFESKLVTYINSTSSPLPQPIESSSPIPLSSIIPAPAPFPPLPSPKSPPLISPLSTQPTTPKFQGKIQSLPTNEPVSDSQTLAFNNGSIKEMCCTLFHIVPRQSPSLPLQRDTHHQLLVSELECPHFPSENITASHEEFEKKTYTQSVSVDRILYPTPPYLLYSASIAIHGGTLVLYYLDETTMSPASLVLLFLAFCSLSQVTFATAIPVRPLPYFWVKETYVLDTLITSLSGDWPILSALFLHANGWKLLFMKCVEFVPIWIPLYDVNFELFAEYGGCRAEHQLVDGIIVRVQLFWLYSHNFFPNHIAFPPLGIYVMVISFIILTLPPIVSSWIPDYLFLEHNFLTGSIQETFKLCGNWMQLELWHNQIVGTITDYISKLSLMRLVLDLNKIMGSILVSLWRPATLLEISAVNNQLEVSLPAEIDNIALLQCILHLNNRICGRILVVEIVNCILLATLNLGNNGLNELSAQLIGYGWSSNVSCVCIRAFVIGHANDTVKDGAHQLMQVAAFKDNFYQFYAACIVGGILSYCLMRMTFTPLDLVKGNMEIDLAKHKSISSDFGVLLKKPGVKGLFMNWVPTLLSYNAQMAYKFEFNEFSKKNYSDHAGPENMAKYKSFIYLAGCACIELIADIALWPLEAMKGQVQTQPRLARGVSVAGGYLVGVLCDTISHPSDNLVSFFNNANKFLHYMPFFLHHMFLLLSVQLETSLVLLDGISEQQSLGVCAYAYIVLKGLKAAKTTVHFRPEASYAASIAEHSSITPAFYLYGFSKLVVVETRGCNGLADGLHEAFQDVHLCVTHPCQKLRSNQHLEDKVVLKVWGNDTPIGAAHGMAQPQPNSEDSSQPKGSEKLAQFQKHLLLFVTKRCQRE